MKLELIIIGITLFFIYNIYHDGKYIKILLSWKKYYQMIMICIFGIGIYLMIKKNPSTCKKMLVNANSVIKYMPIDKSSLDLLNPILDFTNNNKFMENFTNNNDDETEYNNTHQNNISIFNNNTENSNSEKRILNSGRYGTKRSVSETKKKYVAYQQDWKCGKCNNKLNHTFEVDHKIRLDKGGSNDVDNLVALCRECHGKKTAWENM